VTIPYEIEEPGDFTDRKADLRYDLIMQGNGPGILLGMGRMIFWNGHDDLCGFM